MKKIIITIIFICTFLITSVWSIVKTDNIPEINLKVNVSSLTDEDYSYVGTTGIDNPTKDDFKNIKFTLDIKNLGRVVNRKITVPTMKRVLDSYELNRYWFGSLSSQDNLSENFAMYNEELVLYSRNLDEQAIRNIFSTAEVKVSWTTKEGSFEERMFNLGDIILFHE